MKSEFLTEDKHNRLNMRSYKIKSLIFKNKYFQLLFANETQLLAPLFKETRHISNPLTVLSCVLSCFNKDWSIPPPHLDNNTELAVLTKKVLLQKNLSFEAEKS